VTGAGRSGADLPVVLVHGLRTSRTMWRAQVAALRGVGARALAIDLPGHGRRLGEAFTLDGAVTAVADGIEAVGGRALVVGLSLGGYVGITHAARHPEQVAGLVAAACSTTPVPLLVGGWRAAAAAIDRLPDAGAALNQQLVDRMLPPDGARDVGAGGFALSVVGPALRGVAAARPIADLARIGAPVWIVNGQFDHFRSQERQYLAACRDGRLVVVPRATHLVSLVAPVRFSRIVLEAWDELRADGRPGSH